MPTVSVRSRLLPHFLQLSYSSNVNKLLTSMSRMCVKFISLLVLYCWLQVVAGAKPDGTYGSSTESTKAEKELIAYPDDLGIAQFSKQMMFEQHHHHHDPDFHHHHHHHSDFHHNHPGGGTPREEKSPEGSIEVNNLTVYNQIPLDYIQDLNEYNVSDLLLHFVDDGPDSEDNDYRFIQNRFGDDEVQEKSAAILPKGADCMPELRTVKIATTDDPSVLHIPQCTRIERCGGCCKHDLLSCQPLKKESIPFKVYKTQYTGEKKLKFLGTEVIMVEKHNKCKCLCRTKPEDCSKFQEYRESECRCACVNYDEKKKCIRNSDIKLWNPELCACQCRETMQCSTGSYFDQNECRCMAVPRNRVGLLQRRSFRSDPLPVVPLDEEEEY